MAQQDTDFPPKKWPSQQRSRMTFEALVEACARLLAERGYARLTTNHVAERAGVGIASLYEYFPDKDALVARVAERLVHRVMHRLGEHMDAILAAPPENAIALWIDRIHRTLEEEKALVAVFVYEVPYTNRLPVVRNINEELLRFSEQARGRAGVDLAQPRVELYLIINLVSSTILQLVLDPPPDVRIEEMKHALAARVGQWLLPSSAREPD